MAGLGDLALGKTINFKFCTVQTTGAPFTLAGSPVISAYPDNSTTQLTAGITLTVDFDSVTGLNNVAVVATGGNGYLTATDYEMVITTGTVNSVSVVGYVVGSFSIEHRSPLRPATVDRTLVVDAAGLADANAVKVGATGAGTAQTARDLGASVLLSAGSGTGQLDFTSGVVKANPTQWLGGTIPAVNVTGIPVVDATKWVGGTIPAVSVTGVPLVDVKYNLGTIAPTPTVAGTPRVELAGVLAATARAFMDVTRAAELTSLPSQTVPSYSDMLAFLFERARNIMTETATTEILKKADGTTTLGTATNSDDGVTFSRGAAS